MTKIKRRIIEILYYIFFILLYSFDSSIKFKTPLLIIIITLTIVININFNSKITINRGNASKYIIILFIISIISNLYSKGNYYSDMTNMTLFILMYVSIDKYCKDIDNFSKLIRVIFVATFIGGPIIGIYQMITGEFLFPDSGNSVYVSFKMFDAKQSNVNYGALTMQIALFTSLLSASFSKHKTMYYSLSLISFISVVLTFSRGSIGALFIAGLFIIFHKKKASKNGRSWIRLFMFVVVCFALFSIYQNDIMNFIYSEEIQILFSRKEQSDISARSQQWKAALQGLINGNIIEILIGYGTEYATILARYSGMMMSAHNIFFGQLSQNGMVGFILIFSVFLKHMSRIIKLNKYKASTLFMSSFIISIWLSYQFLSIIRWEFWICVILFDVYYKIEYKQKQLNHLNGNILK